jgi:hypothetical protein
MKIYRLLLILTASVLVAQAPPARRMPGAGAGQGLPAVKAFLNLSDAQVQQLIQLRRDEQQALQPIRQQIRTINEDYHNRALALLDDAQKEKLQKLQQAARARPMARGAGALNLLLPPAPPRAGGTDAP